MGYINNKYQQLKQFVMAKTAKATLSKEEAKKEKIKKKEQKDWVKFAKKKKIKTLFFSVAGCIRRTSDGKAYSNPEELSADGWKDWSHVTNAD